MNLKKHKILFILPSLHAGGAERVICVLTENLDRSKYKPEILVIYPPKKNEYKIEGVPVTYLNKSRTLKAIPAIVKHINKHKPDIVLTSIGQLNILGGLLNMFFKNIFFIGREASVKGARSNNKNNFFPKLIYFRLTKIICISTDSLIDFKENYGIPKDKLYLIPNPIYFERINKPVLKNNKVPQLITIGRLDPIKGYDRILKLLTKIDFDFHYTIIGDGSERNNISKLIKDLKLEDKITHIPHTYDVVKYLKKSDVFLQGSYVEGFGMALLESIAVGVPAVIFNAPGGSKDVIIDDVNGFKVNTSEEFIEKLKRTLFDKQWNHNKIIDTAYDRYDLPIVINKYEELFNEVLS